jgi:hypothetical protein
MFDLKSVDLAKRQLGRLLGWISDLRVAIGLLLVEELLVIYRPHLPEQPLALK